MKILSARITLIFLIGLILRLISLNQSLWLDEATTALVTQMNLYDIFTKFLPGDFHPPLYYLFLKVWTIVFGNSEISLRLPSVFFGLGTIFISYLIAKSLFGLRVGIFSAFLLATSGLAVYYSQEARMYSMTAFLTALVVHFLMEKKWFYFSFALLAIGMTDYIALLIIPALLLIDVKNWKKICMALTPLVICFVIWLPVFIFQLRGGLAQEGGMWWNVLGALSIKNVALIPVKFILGRIAFDNLYLYGFIVGLVFVVFGYPLYKSLPLRGDPLKVWVWFLVPIILLIILSIKIPGLSYFRLLFALPAFYILVAFGIFNLKKRMVAVFMILTLMVNGLSLSYYLFNNRFHRENWRQAAEVIAESTVVFPANSQKEALTYYGKENEITFYKDFYGSEEEVWLSRYVWNIFDPYDNARRKLENLGYNKVLEADFNGVVFYKYAYSN